jgi:ribosome-binding protein aMBF1 (putative translation factor)
MKIYKKFKRELLNDGEIARVYRELEPEFIIVQKLIEKRQRRGLSQVALAKKLGTKQSAVSRFESGNYNPTLKFIYRIASALDAKIKISVA